MSRRWQHIITDHGIEGWVPERRWGGALRVACAVAAAGLLLLIGYDLGLQTAIAVIAGQ